jgi:hypothetical protein
MKNEMDRSCDTYGREERCIKDFDGENLRAKDQLEDLTLGGIIIIKYIFKK